MRPVRYWLDELEYVAVGALWLVGIVVVILLVLTLFQ